MSNHWENLKSKTQKRLSESAWFHSTTYSEWDSICQNRIQVKHNLTRSNELDFGYGFYLTDTKERAKNYILQYVQNGILLPQDLLVLEFDFCPAEYQTQHHWKVFEKYDDEFAEFVFLNRLENVAGSKQHCYDWIYGGMTDTKPLQIMADYRMGDITKDVAISEFKKGMSFKQLSIHSQELCYSMQLKSATRFVLNDALEIASEQELDTNEYKQL